MKNTHEALSRLMIQFIDLFVYVGIFCFSVLGNNGANVKIK